MLRGFVAGLPNGDVKRLDANLDVSLVVEENRTLILQELASTPHTCGVGVPVPQHRPPLARTRQGPPLEAHAQQGAAAGSAGAVAGGAASEDGGLLRVVV